MGLKQCPICELNYIRDDEKHCNICRRNMKEGTNDFDEQLLCSECGESAPLSGQDLCAYCLNEKRRREKLEKLMEKPSIIEMDVEQLNEIDVAMPSDIPGDDLTELNKEYGDEEEEDEADFEEEALIES